MKPKGLWLTMALVCGALAGCEQEGPAEKAGERIDEAVEQTQDAIDDAGQQGTMERMGEKLDQSMEEAGEAVEDAGDEMQDAAQ
jgi:predicted small lipoprotein YifL